MKKIRIWDLPTRVFHWSLAFSVLAAIVAAKIGGNAMDWHFRLGYLALSLVIFRLLWGMVGPHYARFSNFVPSPGKLLTYIKKTGKAQALSEPSHGHNPLGALSVLAMLGIIFLQTISGLFSNDDIASEGPLIKFISKQTSDQVSWLHSQVSGNLIYALISLHLLAICFYYFKKKENLITPMLTGDKHLDANITAAKDTWSVRILALSCALVCAAAVYGLQQL
jgi:cytochrome b